MELKDNRIKETDNFTWEQRFDICFPVSECDFSEDNQKIKNFIKKYFVLKSELIESDNFWRDKYSNLLKVKGLAPTPPVQRGDKKE